MTFLRSLLSPFSEPSLNSLASPTRQSVASLRLPFLGLTDPWQLAAASRDHGRVPTPPGDASDSESTPDSSATTSEREEDDDEHGTSDQMSVDVDSIPRGGNATNETLWPELFGSPSQDVEMADSCMVFVNKTEHTDGLNGNTIQRQAGPVDDNEDDATALELLEVEQILCAEEDEVTAGVSNTPELAVGVHITSEEGRMLVEEEWTTENVDDLEAYMRDLVDQRDFHQADAAAAYQVIQELELKLDFATLQMEAAQNMLAIVSDQKQALGRLLVATVYRHTPVAGAPLRATRLRTLFVEFMNQMDVAERTVPLSRLRPVGTSASVAQRMSGSAIKIVIAGGRASPCNSEHSALLLHYPTMAMVEYLGKSEMRPIAPPLRDGDMCHVFLPAASSVVGDGILPHAVVYGGLYRTCSLHAIYPDAIPLPDDLPSFQMHKDMGLGSRESSQTSYPFDAAIPFYRDGRPEVGVVGLRLVEFNMRFNSALEKAFAARQGA